MAWPEAGLSCWLESCWLRGRHRTYFWIWFLPVCEYQDDIGLSPNKKFYFLLRMKEKVQREKEREKFSIVLSSLSLWKQDFQEKKKIHDPLTATVWPILPQPLDSFFLFFSPLSISMYFLRKPSINHFRSWTNASSAVNRYLAIDLCAFCLINSRNCVARKVKAINEQLVDSHFSDHRPYNFPVLKILITI